LAALMQERQRTAAALQASTAHVRALAGRLIAAQEAERSRIAAELHDDVNQQPAALAVSLSGVQPRLPGGAAGARDDLTELQQRLVALSEDVRQLSHELHPGVLQHAGLVAALRARCAEFRSQHSVEVIFQAGPGLDSLLPEPSLCLYRVAQE